MTAPQPRPCTARAATNTGMSTAVPARSRPAVNRPTPTTIGRVGPRASHTSPATTIANRLVTTKALNAQA